MLVFQWAILSQFRDLIGITDEWFKDSINMHLYVLLTISIPVWLYFAYFDSKYAKGTFGKRLFKLKLRSLPDRQISFGRSFLRTFLKLLPWEIAHLGVIYPEPVYFQQDADIHFVTYIGLLLFLVYVISIFVNRARQTLYDKVVNTHVV
jgi:uncharacterized RDD family membrane protein YckC